MTEDTETMTEREKTQAVLTLTNLIWHFTGVKPASTDLPTLEAAWASIQATHSKEVAAYLAEERKPEGTEGGVAELPETEEHECDRLWTLIAADIALGSTFVNDEGGPVTRDSPLALLRICAGEIERDELVEWLEAVGVETAEKTLSELRAIAAELDAPGLVDAMRATDDAPLAEQLRSESRTTAKRRAAVIAASLGLEVMGEPTRREEECELSQDELLSRGEHLAQLVEAVTELEQQKKDYAATINARIKVLQEETAEVAKPLRTHRDEVEVDIAFLGDFAANEVLIVRLDTGDVVDRRPMNGPERERLAQRSLFPTPDETLTDEEVQRLTEQHGEEKVASVIELISTHGAASVESALDIVLSRMQQDDDVEEPPALTHGMWPAALRRDPIGPLQPGRVTKACVEDARFDGAHVLWVEVRDETDLVVSARQRHARYIIGEGRYAFVPWPGEPDVEEWQSEATGEDVGRVAYAVDQDEAEDEAEDDAPAARPEWSGGDEQRRQARKNLLGLEG